MEIVVPEFPSYMLVWMECECVVTDFVPYLVASKSSGGVKVTWNADCPKCYGIGILPFPVLEMTVRCLSREQSK